jgi:hypothetical protein
MKTGMAVALVMVTVMAMTGSVAADGERTPMFGGSLTYSNAPDRKAELVGGELEAAWWIGRFGIGIDGAARHAVTDDRSRNLAVAGSARLLLASWLTPALLEPRDVEAGLELHVIAERTWWSRDDRSDALGLGIALRLRGGSDWEFSSLLAESRVFLRVMQSQSETSSLIARTADAMAVPPERRGIFVIAGIGAAFGAGKSRYLERFRLRPRELWTP